MALARKAEPFSRLPLLGHCLTCRQMTLERYAASRWSIQVILTHCPDCDGGHCPVCRAHPVGPFARVCLQCGSTLDPRVGTTAKDERPTAH